MARMLSTSLSCVYLTANLINRKVLMSSGYQTITSLSVKEKTYKCTTRTAAAAPAKTTHQIQQNIIQHILQCSQRGISGLCAAGMTRTAKKKEHHLNIPMVLTEYFDAQIRLKLKLPGQNMMIAPEILLSSLMTAPALLRPNTDMKAWLATADASGEGCQERC